MDELEEKLNSVLNDPKMMQQILTMAQSLGSVPVNGDSQGLPDIAMLQKLTGLAQQGNIDGDQRALLIALRPYLSQHRLSRLEKAMRAARIAQATSALLGTGVLQSRTGR